MFQFRGRMKLRCHQAQNGVASGCHVLKLAPRGLCHQPKKTTPQVLCPCRLRFDTTPMGLIGCRSAPRVVPPLGLCHNAFGVWEMPLRKCHSGHEPRSSRTRLSDQAQPCSSLRTVRTDLVHGSCPLLSPIQRGKRSGLHLIGGV